MHTLLSKGEIVLRLHVFVWQSDDGEAAKRSAVKRYQLSTAEGDQVEVLKTLQIVDYEGSISL